MEIIRNEIITTSKPHECWGCGETFEAGSELKCVVIADQEVISTNFWCDVCDEVIAHWENLEEIEFGEVKASDPEFWEEIKSKLDQTPPTP